MPISHAFFPAGAQAVDAAPTRLTRPRRRRVAAGDRRRGRPRSLARSRPGRAPRPSIEATVRPPCPEPRTGTTTSRTSWSASLRHAAVVANEPHAFMSVPRDVEAPSDSAPPQAPREIEKLRLRFDRPLRRFAVQPRERAFAPVVAHQPVDAVDLVEGLPDEGGQPATSGPQTLTWQCSPCDALSSWQARGRCQQRLTAMRVRRIGSTRGMRLFGDSSSPRGGRRGVEDDLAERPGHVEAARRGDHARSCTSFSGSAGRRASRSGRR